MLIKVERIAWQIVKPAIAEPSFCGAYALIKLLIVDSSLDVV